MNFKLAAIVACVFAFLSLPLEWWTLQGSSGIVTESHNIYLYMIISKGLYSNMFSRGLISSFYSFPTMEGLVALVLIIVGGIFAAISSIREEHRLLLASGACIALAVVVFSGRWLLVGLVTGLAPYPNLGLLFALLSVGITFYGYLEIRKESTIQAAAEATV